MSPAAAGEVGESPATVAPDEPLLRVVDLTRHFGGVRAVDGASLEVRRGLITGLIGPNGAGKSTLLNVVAGSMAPSSGSVLLEGHEIAGMPAHRVARQGVIRTFQLSSEFAKLTVLENLLVATPHHPGESLWGALAGSLAWGARERELVAQARELMRRFDMATMEDELAGNLSGGQKRLLELMRALMAGPRLLLLDEPMAGVNPTLGERIQGYLAELRGEGLTMLMVEHEMSIVERLCDVVIVMAQGRVIAEGRMDELRSRREVLDAYLSG